MRGIEPVLFFSPFILPFSHNSGKAVVVFDVPKDNIISQQFTQSLCFEKMQLDFIERENEQIQQTIIQ